MNIMWQMAGGGLLPLRPSAWRGLVGGGRYAALAVSLSELCEHMAAVADGGLLPLLSQCLDEDWWVGGKAGKGRGRGRGRGRGGPDPIPKPGPSY